MFASTRPQPHSRPSGAMEPLFDKPAKVNTNADFLNSMSAG